MFDLKEFCLRDKEGKIVKINENSNECKLDVRKVLNKINFEEDNLSFLYKNVAYATMKLITKQDYKSISTTQFRKFYDKILEINEKSRRVDEENFNIKIKPILNLMYSKVQYAVTRKQAGNNFKNIMYKCLDKVNSKEELERFKLFLEAIIGFMPKN